MDLFPNNPEWRWEREYFQKLSLEERKLMWRYTWRRMRWSWQMWTVHGCTLAIVPLSFFAYFIVDAAGGSAARHAAALVLHLIYVAVIFCLLLPLNRRIVRALLRALDAHDKENHTEPNSAP